MKYRMNKKIHADFSVYEENKKKHVHISYRFQMRKSFLKAILQMRGIPQTELRF